MSEIDVNLGIPASPEPRTSPLPYEGIISVTRAEFEQWWRNDK